MDTMLRLALFALPAVAAWAALACGWTDGVVLAGTAAVVTGAWLILEERRAAGLASLLTLPAVLGVLAIGVLGGGARPISIPPPRWYGPYSPYVFYLPAASEGRIARADRAGNSDVSWVGISQYGHVNRGRLGSLRDAERKLERDFELHDARFGLDVDKETPWRHVGWMLDIARRHGRNRVVLGVVRFPVVRRLEDPEDQLGIERYEYAPPARLTLRLRDSARAPVRLRVVATREGWWGPPREYGRPLSRERVTVPARIRFEYRDRATEDLMELARWMRADPPDGIDSAPTIQWKYVVAVLNQMAKLGIDAVHLGPIEPPTDEERNAVPLPYPR
jgi:hypothetical protein